MWLERPLIHKSVHVEEKPNISLHCGVRTYSSMTDKLLTFRDSEFNVNDILLSVSCGSWWRDGFPGGSSGKEPACQCRRCKTLRFSPWVRKIPWWRAWQPTPVFLPGESPWTEEAGGIQSIVSQRVRLKCLSMQAEPVDSRTGVRPNN